jgi:lipopolysaccharide/colanic/teichoic acid biosynthesis glycosyltransferase
MANVVTHSLARYAKMLFAGRRADDLEQRIPTLPPADRFRVELERQILRAERSAVPLTVLRLWVSRPEAPHALDHHGMEILADILAGCMRTCDDRGWFRGDRGPRICVLLFGTHPHLVDTIMNRVRVNFQAAASREIGPGVELLIHYDLLSYPAEGRKSNGNGNGNGSGHSNGIGNGKVNGNGNGNGHSNGNGKTPPIEACAEAEDEEIEYVMVDGFRVHPRVASAEALIAQPLPVWKRALDLIGSGLGLIVLFPVFALFGLLIKLSSKGPVFFRQERVGQSGRIFECLKFRSMESDFDQRIHRKHVGELIESCAKPGGGKAPMKKLDEQNAKITWVGRLLRPSHMDELAQLINVWRGEMSLVGPRPCIPYEAQKYQTWCLRRFDALPGITGLWQVKGKNDIDFHNMVRLDIIYSRRRSLALDLWILLLTIPTILKDVISETRLFRAKGATS